LLNTKKLGVNFNQLPAFAILFSRK
jgi:hypothetical protein